jgi:GAF domain-containing protein
LAVELHDAASIAETVERVLKYTLRATGCDCAGVVLVHRGKDLQTAGVTDGRVEQADRLQLAYGEGPCVPVSRAHHSVTIRDTVVDRRWPRWSPEVAELGLRSMLTVWLFTSRSTLGALNLYRNRPGKVTAADEATAQLLAALTAVAIATIQQSSTLTKAVDARTRIGQAQGLLMERFAINADQAFAVLRRYSQDSNVKLQIVADELVTTRRLPTRSPAGAADRSPSADRCVDSV